MSYATELKGMLCDAPPKKLCCRKAHISGFLYTVGSHSDKEITVTVGGRDIAEYFAALVREAYQCDTQMFTRRGGGDNRDIRFNSPSAVSYLTAADGGESPIKLMRCEDCRKYFLRGVFIAAAHPCDPAKEIRMDICPTARITELSEYLASQGLAPRMSKRSGREFLYYRSGETIADFIGMMGLTDVYFTLQNESLKRELSNLTNRQNNCTVSNIGRSVENLTEQVRVLRRMREENKLSLLTDELRQTAELRLKYDNYSLSQLAAVAVPAITKSGLNHRLQRIMEVARKLNL